MKHLSELLRNTHTLKEASDVITAAVGETLKARKKLLQDKRAELAAEEAKVQEERAHGDTSENVAYTIAVAAVSALRIEIANLESSIQRHEEFDGSNSMTGDIVTVGSTVRITDRTANGGQSTWIVKIYPPGIGDARNGGIAADTPLGAALCGHREGAMVTFKAPRGDMRYTIEEVLKT